MNEKIQPPAEVVARPTLVTILIVLTILGTVGYLGYEAIAASSPELRAQSAEMPKWLTIGIFVMQIAKTGAAILLWKMRRMGFFIYAAAEFIAAVFAIITTKANLDYIDLGYAAPELGFDPKIFVLLVMGMSLGLSIAFIGGFAAHLGKMR